MHAESHYTVLELAEFLSFTSILFYHYHILFSIVLYIATFCVVAYLKSSIIRETVSQKLSKLPCVTLPIVSFMPACHDNYCNLVLLP